MVLDWWQSLCFSVEAVNHDSLTAHCESRLLTLFFLILHLYRHIHPTRKLFFPPASLQSSKTFINNLQMDRAPFFYLKVKSELSKFKYVNLSKLVICRCTIHLKCGMCWFLSPGRVIGWRSTNFRKETNLRDSVLCFNHINFLSRLRLDLGIHLHLHNVTRVTVGSQMFFKILYLRYHRLETSDVISKQMSSLGVRL